MTVSTYIDMVLFVIENGFAICQCCKDLRKRVFQIPCFSLFNECHSSTRMGDLIPYRRSSMSIGAVWSLGERAPTEPKYTW